MFTYKPEDAKVPIKVWMSKEDYDSDPEMIKQIETVAKLPFIRKHVVLTPDGHTGFGVPIGGVLACKNIIIPYAVGSDGGCGMKCLN